MIKFLARDAAGAQIRVEAVVRPEVHPDGRAVTDTAHRLQVFHLRGGDEQAIADAAAVTYPITEVFPDFPKDHPNRSMITNGGTHGPLLFCCRVRGMRPQGAALRSIPKPLWPLFDAAGPERNPKDFGNTPRPEEAGA